MEFPERHEQIIKKASPITHWKIWLKAIVFSLVSIGLGVAYIWYRSGKFDMFNFNQVLACASVFLIGCSFILSAVCYFWNFFDTKIIYRKYLGIIGAIIGLLHIVVIIFTQQTRFDADYFFREHLWTFLAGLVALMLFTVMVFISNNFSIHELGSKRWRHVLRYTGYVAFILVFLHFVFIVWPRWEIWWTSFDPWLPPLSLLAAVFMAIVLIFRMALAIALWRHARATKAPLPTTTPPAAT